MKENETWKKRPSAWDPKPLRSQRTGGHSHLKRAPVKTWATMTEEERAAILAALKNGGKP